MTSLGYNGPIMSEMPSENAKFRSSPLRVGAVSFFNAYPLISGLPDNCQVKLDWKVPSALADALEDKKLDVALIPSIDYQLTTDNWTILPCGCIGSQGSVLTVRVFSRIPLEQVEHVACDTDSHTSVTLLQIVYYLRYGRRLSISPLESSTSQHRTILLIGDKVLDQLGCWDYELDLGSAWADLTGLPFVYAFWAATETVDLSYAIDILNAAKREGLLHLDAIADKYGHKHGFNSNLARQYLRKNICYEFGPGQQQALLRFYELAQELALIDHAKPLKLANVPETQSTAQK